MAIYTLRPYIELVDFRDVYVPPLSWSQFLHISLTSYTIIYVKEKKIQRGDRGTETLKVGPIFRKKVKNHTFFLLFSNNFCTGWCIIVSHMRVPNLVIPSLVVQGEANWSFIIRSLISYNEFYVIIGRSGLYFCWFTPRPVLQSLSDNPHLRNLCPKNPSEDLISIHTYFSYLTTWWQ